MSEMAQHPVVRLSDGAVRGRVESGVAAFLGIPYAAPPFGANRMLPPQPVPPWDGRARRDRVRADRAQGRLPAAVRSRCSPRW